MARIASPYWLRADGAVIPWREIVRGQLEQRGSRELELGRLLEERLALVKERPADVHLRWSCSERLGVPFEPFGVWIRPPRDPLDDVDVRIHRVEEGLALRRFGVAAIIEVTCDVVDPSRAVGLFASRGGGSLRETVGAVAVRQPGGGQVTLRVRTSGATRVVLVNGDNPVVRVRSLQDVIDDPGWRLVERVGLPADDPWPPTAYRAADQGLVAALTDPTTAALERLARGGPPVGWSPLTESGVLAPTWRAPDHGILVDEVRKDLLPRIEAIYAPGVLPFQQAAIREQPVVARPRRGTRQSSLSAHAELAPLALLGLPAASEPFLALATGFGTAYGLDEGEEVPFGRVDFLVTGAYEETPRSTGPIEVAAFVPLPAPHGATAAATNLLAARDGLVAPDVVDGPWRESVRVSWDRQRSTAALGRPSGAVVARFDPAGPPVATSLVPERSAGDLRPLVPVPDGPEGSPGFARSAMVDAAAEIPLGSGGRSAGYAVVLEDVFGVWSRWEDALYQGPEPAPARPRILSLTLAADYDGFTICPAVLEVELAVDWADRTPTGLDLAAIFYRMPAANTPTPDGLDPDLPAPGGMFRRLVALPFAGDELTGPAGATIEHLDGAGQELVAPGPMQGDHGRRYRVRLPVPTLDFATVPRWGVQVWVRSHLAVLATPTEWSPDPEHPAIAVAGSPVPVAPLPPPLPPGVPLGSIPDADGRSHGRIRWSLPAGAPVDKVIIWEVAETALRESAGLPPRAPDGRLPGLRLADAWAAYDGLPAARRRSAFRRLRELPGSARDVDVALPKGSTDIHFYTVTTLSATAVESPWPDGTPAHAQLQAIMAPRIRQPTAPRVRSVVGPADVTLELSAASRIPVQAFRVFRTRSGVAARSADSMGPPFATVTAIAPPTGTPADPTTGERTWTGTWTGTFDPSWDDWFVRAVAVPVDGVPPEAVRGRPSPACEPVTIVALPTAPPDLAPLVAELWGAASDGLVIRTSTAAPVRPVGLGSHRLSGVAGAAEVGPVDLEAIDETGATPPPGATPGPALVRAPRAAGRTPLAVWFTRPVPSDPVDVVLRLADPLGRVTEQRLTVPGFVPAVPPTLELVDRTTIVGRGTVFTLRSDAPIDADPPYVLEVRAARRTGPRFPFPPRPPFPIGRPQPVTASFPLDEIPDEPRPFLPARPIQALRTKEDAPFEYAVLVRITGPFTVRFTMVAPDGARTEVVDSVP
jgi:hypothetical protein